MSEISLRDYFAKLQTLLNASAADEVIHHCRHILQYYPKNVAAYRFLGRALLLNGRWDEAAAAFRRVLSVVPDDFHAHHGLSEIFDHRQKANDAIWHMERAFEQNPNSHELLESLRSLYRRYRSIDQAKIQLTAAAVARQSLRNGNYDQALDTLRDAIERQPDRVDLRLLLAQALWSSGNHVEAAEIALDVLQELPDCLEANRMLTSLWLEEERPSDAQRYLNRVEAIDPYLAVELAQGQPPTDDAFRLEEADYERELQSELTLNKPDWLENISTAPPSEGSAQTDDWSGFMSSMLASTNAETQEEEAPASGDLFAEDWMELPQQPSHESSPVDEDEIPAEFAALPGQAEDDNPTLLSGFTPPAAFDNFEDEDAEPGVQEEDPLGWLEQAQPELFAETSDDDDAVINLEEPDAMAWLQDDLLSDEARNERSQPKDEDAFAWMQGYDVDIIEDQPTLPEPDVPLFEGAASEEEDALQWLQSQEALDEVLGLEQLTTPTIVESKEELPEWLNTQPEMESEAEIEADAQPDDDLFASLQGTAPMAVEGASSLFDEPSAEDSAWLSDISEEDAQSVPGPRRGLTALLNETDFDWVKSQEPQDDPMSDAVMDEWLAQFGAESKPAAAEEPDWLNELDTAMNDKHNAPSSSDENPEWLSASGSEAEPEKPAEETFDWLNSEPSDEAQPADLSDWMADSQPAKMSQPPEAGAGEEADAAEDFDWSIAEASDDAIAADIPDWLTQLEPVSDEPSSAEAAFGETDDIEEQWLNAEPTATEPSEADPWLDDAAIEEEAELAGVSDQPAAEENSPDWLSELGLPAQETSTPAEPSAAPSQDFEWDDELEIEAEAAETVHEAAVSADVPEWLSELQTQFDQPAEASRETQPEAGISETDDETWLNELEIEAEADIESESVEAVEAVSDVPDWLSEIQPQQPETQTTSEQSAEADEADWLNELEDEELTAFGEAEQPESQPTAEAEEAFAALLQDETAPDEEATPIVEAGDMEWLSEVEIEEEAEPALEPSPAEPTADLPDWLSDLEPVHSDQVDAIEPVTEPVATEQQEDYGWLDEAAPETEAITAAETEAVEDDFTWVNELPNDTAEPETQTGEALQEEEFEEFVEETESDPDLVPSFALEFEDEADDEDDFWLNEETAQEPDVVSGEPFDQDAFTETEAADDAFISSEEDFEPVPASNAPDWLNAMVPGLDVDYEAAEDEPIETEFLREAPAEPEDELDEQREFSWVEDIVEEESRQMEPVTADAPQRRFSFSRPPAWFSKLTRSSQSAGNDDELPDWPSDEPDWQR